MAELLTVADRLRFARELRGLSRRALSQKAGLADAHVGMIERGEVGDPAGSTASKLARALHVDATWLLDGEGPSPSIDDDDTIVDTIPAPAPEAR